MEAGGKKSLSKTERIALIKRQQRNKPKNDMRENITPHKTETQEPPKKEIIMSQETKEEIDNLMAICKQNIDVLDNNTDLNSTIKNILTAAEHIWLHAQILNKTTEQTESSLDQRIAVLKKEYKDFYESFPMITNFMIHPGEYSQNAFKKLTIKYIGSKLDKDNWIDYQADYMRFMWEETDDFSQQESDEMFARTKDAILYQMRVGEDNRKKQEDEVNDNITKFNNEFKDNIYNITEEYQKEYGESEESLTENVYIKTTLIEAEEVWLNVRVLSKSNKYKKMTDDEKIALIQTDFKKFHNDFPIVSKYMICLLEYDRDAFKKMLQRCKSVTTLHRKPVTNKQIDKDNNKGKEIIDNTPEEEPNAENTKDFNQMSWIERQSDYVRFLWENNQKSFKQEDSDKIWDEAYNSLNEEFQEFQRLHDEKEEKIKQDNIKHKKELLYEMSDRIIDDKQHIANEGDIHLLNTLKDKLYQQRARYNVKEMNKVFVKIETKNPDICVEGYGYDDIAADEYNHEMQQSELRKKYKKLDIGGKPQM
jgi:hypothetical protein